MSLLIVPSSPLCEPSVFRDKPVVKKALVDMDGAPMRAYRALRDHWAMYDCYRSPGPVQFSGHRWANVGCITLALERNGGDPILLTPMEPEDGEE